MDISVSGFKEKGDWDDIVEHGKRITRVLRDQDVDDEDDLEEWDEWRPKADESLEGEVTEKTAEQASIEEGKGEQEGKAPTEDIKEAGKKATKSTSNLKDASKHAPTSPKDAAGRVNDAGEDLQESAGYLARAVDSLARKVLRKVENSVYMNVMTQVSPHYFDNQLISANITKQSGILGDDTRFVFEVNINDDHLKETVKEEVTDGDEADDNGEPNRTDD